SCAARERRLRRRSEPRRARPRRHAAAAPGAGRLPPPARADAAGVRVEAARRGAARRRGFGARHRVAAAGAGPAGMIALMETELLAMRSAVESARYLLEAPGAAEARRLRDAVPNQLDDYVVPRFAQLDAPLLAVVGGSTGAGKSTLVNALVGDVV